MTKMAFYENSSGQLGFLKPNLIKCQSHSCTRAVDVYVMEDIIIMKHVCIFMYEKMDVVIEKFLVTKHSRGQCPHAQRSNSGQEAMRWSGDGRSPK